MTAPMSTDRGELTITRLLAAPRHLVWRAFTTPEGIAAFWGGNHATIPVESVVMDVRAGGGFELVTVAADGTERAKRGHYLEVDELNRIVFSEPDTKITTTVTFANSGSGTVLTIHQAGVPPELLTPMARAGLSDMVTKLELTLAAMPLPDPPK